MSPTPFRPEHNYHHHHRHQLQFPVKQETSSIIATNNNDVCARMCPSSLKIHRDSHIIKKPPTPTVPSHYKSPSRVTFPPTGCTTNKPQNQQRGPVIIYTHSPKVIHTNPSDFKALVQKLTGMSSSEGAGPKGHDAPSYHPEQQLLNAAPLTGNSNTNCNISTSNDDNESTSIVTDENSCSSSDVMGELQFLPGPPLFEPPLVPPLLGASLPDFPFYMPTSSDLLHCSGDPSVYDYMNSSYPFNQSTYF